uniref:Uncharacterized protein n=1 Tax=Anguilla anguilla TaxID=7936 RepID=A0A0E9VNJ7_ANGAN
MFKPLTSRLLELFFISSKF